MRYNFQRATFIDTLMTAEASYNILMRMDNQKHVSDLSKWSRYIYRLNSYK